MSSQPSTTLPSGVSSHTASRVDRILLALRPTLSTRKAPNNESSKQHSHLLKLQVTHEAFKTPHLLHTQQKPQGREIQPEQTPDPLHRREMFQWDTSGLRQQHTPSTDGDDDEPVFVVPRAYWSGWALQKSEYLDSILKRHRTGKILGPLKLRSGLELIPSRTPTSAFEQSQTTTPHVTNVLEVSRRASVRGQLAIATVTMVYVTVLTRGPISALRATTRIATEFITNDLTAAMMTATPRETARRWVREIRVRMREDKEKGEVRSPSRNKQSELRSEEQEFLEQTRQISQRRDIRTHGSTVAPSRFGVEKPRRREVEIKRA
ncbi:hypothetical protein BJV78DRAFT_1356173 [Lactifluus subvellereus]|nr:hypothetical protein BJV78DRAFT_1356173 [Lactifluus subvellereus]